MTSTTAKSRINFRGFKTNPSKYKNVRCEFDGMRFDSIKECNYYRQLKALVTAGDVVTFIRQVPFHLPGGVKYVADFMIFWASGEVAVVDVKGVRTSEYKAKKKLVEHFYPITIEEV